MSHPFKRVCLIMLLLGAFLPLQWSVVWGETTVPEIQMETQMEAQVPKPQPSVQPQQKRSKIRKGRVRREKEAEGTQALNRFDADLILKSKYELNGQSLEVDPD